MGEIKAFRWKNPFIGLIIVIPIAAFLSRNKIYSLVTQTRFGFFSNHTIPLEIINASIGLLGVLVGVYLTNLSTKNKEVLNLRRETLSDFINLRSEIAIFFHKLEHAVREEKVDDLHELQIVNLKVINMLGSFHVKSLTVFKNSFTLAAINRFLESYDIVSNTIVKSSNIDLKLLKVASVWLNTQASDLNIQLMEDTNIPTEYGVWKFLGMRFQKYYSGGLWGFHEFDIAKAEKIKFNIEKPPWEPHIIFHFRVEPTPEHAKSVYDTNIKRIKDIRCAEHGWAPHLIFYGQSIKGVMHSNCIACCDGLLKQVDEAMKSLPK